MSFLNGIVFRMTMHVSELYYDTRGASSISQCLFFDSSSKS